jgi:hypothetical protein
MGELRVKLDGVLLDIQPQGIDELNQRITFNQEEKTLGVIYDGNLTFYSEGYEILRKAREDNKENIPCVVQKFGTGSWVNEIVGVITISSVKYNRFKRYAIADIEDNSFFSRFRNNFQLPTYVTSAISKNGVSFTGLAEFNLACFNPATGVRDTGGGGAGFATNGLRKAYDLKEALRVLMATASDNELTLASSWYDSGSTNEQICLLTGKALRTAVADPFETQLSLVWNFFRKTHNLVMYPSGSTVNVEQNTALEDTTSPQIIRNVPDVEQYVNQGLMYAGIKFGTKAFKETGSFPYERFIGFRDESYQFAGLSNIDSLLDLSDNNFIVDSNRIEDVLVNDNSDYDQDIFVIAYNSSDGYAAQENPLAVPAGASARVYNKMFLNSEIADRYELQNNIQVSEADPTGTFKALNTADVSESSVTNTFPYPIPTDDDCTDGFDPSGNFDGGAICGGTSTYLFTAQNSGLHTFRIELAGCFDSVDIPYELAEQAAGRLGSRLDLFIELVNGAGAVIASIQAPTQVGSISLLDPPFVQIFTLVGYVSSADTVGLRITPSTNRVSVRDYTSGLYVPVIRKNAIFEATYVPGQGTVVKNYDSTKYISTAIEYDYPLSDQDRRTMISDPTKAIKVFDDSGNITGFPLDVDSNILTGETTFKLRTSKSLIN